MRKSSGWTPERRAKQAEAIHRWKPWEKSTGPRTAEGKARSSMNARQSERMQELRRIREMASGYLAHIREARRDFKRDGGRVPVLRRETQTERATRIIDQLLADLEKN